MKRHIILYIVLVLLLAACGPTPSLPKRGGGSDAAATQLALIDSLADVSPDSADILLNSVAPHLSGKGVGGTNMAPLLLRIKIDDKLYRPITHYRDTILQLVDYFEQHPRVLPRLLGKTGPALPYLYAGRIYSDLGDAPQALDYYQRALDVMPDGQIENGECKTDNAIDSRVAKQRNLLCSLIGNLFSYQYLFEEAVPLLEQANHWASLASDTNAMIFNYRDLAEQYKYLDKPDCSLFHYEYALLLANQSNNTNMANDVKMQIARLYVSEGRFGDALSYIRPALNSIDSADISPTYAIASDIYKGCGNRDSALYCYQQLLRYGNIFGKHHAYQELSEIAVSANDMESANEYYRQYKLLDDSIRKMDNAETVARMHAAYNYQKHERKVKELELQNERKRNAIYFGVIVFLFAAIVIFHYIRSEMKNKVRLKQRLDMLNMKLSEYDKGRNPENWIRRVKEYEDQIHQLQEQLSQKNSDFNVEREILSSRISKLTDEKRSLELSIQRASNRVLDADLAVKTFSQTEIYKLFIRKAYIASAVTGEEWDDFIAQAEGNFFPGFRDNLAALCKISEQEYRMCLLFKSAFSKSQVATLLFVDRSAVSHAFERLYKKAVKRQGKTKDWEVILSSL